MNPRSIVANLDGFFGSKGLRLDIEAYTFFDETEPTKKSKPDAYIYRLIEGPDIIGTVSISNTTKYNIHDKRKMTIHVRDIYVPIEHRGKGIARAILLYGLCHSMVKCPRIRFSDLDDNTPFANEPSRNLYHEFGYRFKEGDPQEKMVDIASFQQNELRTVYAKVTTFPTTGRNKRKRNSQSKDI